MFVFECPKKCYVSLMYYYLQERKNIAFFTYLYFKYLH